MNDPFQTAAAALAHDPARAEKLAAPWWRARRAIAPHG
jgi:hypothetical protein